MLFSTAQLCTRFLGPTYSFTLYPILRAHLLLYFVPDSWGPLTPLLCTRFLGPTYSVTLYPILGAHLLRYFVPDSWGPLTPLLCTRFLGPTYSVTRGVAVPHYAQLNTPPPQSGRRGYEIYGVCVVLIRAQE
jgi:hypothetical protein